MNRLTDITIYLEMAVKIVAMIVSVVLIPLINSKVSETKRKQIAAWVTIAVQAAEEAERSGLIDKNAKYQYAVDLLEENGITFEAETIQGLIDSTVWELFNQFKEDSEKGE